MTIYCNICDVPFEVNYSDYDENINCYNCRTLKNKRIKMKQRTFKTIILEDLKKRGLNQIAAQIKSVRYKSFSMGNAVRVHTLDLFKPERDLLDEILQAYAYGRFDAMTDYAYAERDNKKERQAKYVTLTNNFSEAILSACKIKDEKNYWQVACSLTSYNDALNLLEKNTYTRIGATK